MVHRRSKSLKEPRGAPAPLSLSAMTKPEPERSCIVTREALPKGELLRFVVGPEKKLVPDVAGKLPGKGIYLKLSRQVLTEALAKKAFARVAKTPLVIPENLSAIVEEQLTRRVLDALSLARKSGQVILGFEKVEDAAKTGKVEALIHASDAGDDGVKKLGFYRGPVITHLSRERLSTVLSRENAVHVAVIHGPMTGFFLEENRRLQRFLD